VRRELAGRVVPVGQGAKVLFEAWIWPQAGDVEEGLGPDWGKGAILGVPMGGCFSQEEHRLQSRPGLKWAKFLDTKPPAKSALEQSGNLAIL